MQLSTQLESLIGVGNLKKVIPRKTYSILEVLFSPCCGLGKKIVDIVDGSGNSYTITSYPVTFDGSPYNSKEELEDAICEFYGNGYSVFIMSSNKKILVIGNRSNSEEGIVLVDDTIEVS